MKRAKFAPGTKVKSIDNHPLLSVSKRHVGVVVESYVRSWTHDVEVKFGHKNNCVIFQASELKRV